MSGYLLSREGDAPEIAALVTEHADLDRQIRAARKRQRQLEGEADRLRRAAHGLDDPTALAAAVLADLPAALDQVHAAARRGGDLVVEIAHGFTVRTERWAGSQWLGVQTPDLHALRGGSAFGPWMAEHKGPLLDAVAALDGAKPPWVGGANGYVVVATFVDRVHDR